MTGFVVLVYDVTPTSHLFGESLGRLILPAIIVGFVARSSSSRWATWVYPLILLIVGLALTVLILGGNQQQERRESDERRAAATLYRVTIPETVGEWRKLTSKEIKAQVSDVRALLLQELSQAQRDQTERLLGAYFVRKGTADVIGLFAVESKSRSNLEAALLADPGAFLTGIASTWTDIRDHVGGGDDGPLRCGRARATDQIEVRACAWVQDNTFGIVIAEDDLKPQKAAALARLLRSGVLVER